MTRPDDDREPTAPDASGAAPVASADPLQPDLVMEPPRNAKEARKQARRRAAQADWRSELEGKGARLRAWLDMLFADHAVLRYVFLNLHPVGGSAWRSAQPLPHQVRRMARRGVRAVISLRGGVLFGSYPLEREACEAMGIEFRRAVLRSRGLPSREELAALRALIAEIPTPVLFHCKSGSDRAGFMAALWMIEREGATAAEAQGQLSLRYLHLSRGPTGILDLFFARAAEAEARGVPFDRWVDEEYDRDALLAEHRAGRKSLGARISGWITDRLLHRE